MSFISRDMNSNLFRYFGQYQFTRRNNCAVIYYFIYRLEFGPLYILMQNEEIVIIVTANTTLLNQQQAHSM